MMKTLVEGTRYIGVTLIATICTLCMTPSYQLELITFRTGQQCTLQVIFLQAMVVFLSIMQGKEEQVPAI